MTTQQTFTLAIQHHQAGRLAEAEALYRQILDVQPNHADARHHLGVIAYQLGRHEPAIEMIRQALVFDPNNPAAHSNLGEVYYSTRRFDEAVTSFRRALALKPDYPEAHYNLGNALNASGQSGEAIAAFRRALQLRPDYAEAHNNLGMTLAAQSQFDEAIAAYRQAVQFKPDQPVIHNNLGIALKEMGRLDEAITAYQQALELKSDYARAHFNLGNAFSGQERFDDAITAYRRALAIKPDSAETYNNLGHAFGECGQSDEAIAAFHRALQLKPDYAAAHNNLGNAFRDRDRWDEACASYRQAIQWKPDYALAHNNLGNLLRDQGQLDEAIATYGHVLELEPDYADAYNNLGNAFKERGQVDEALAAYRHALELKPGWAEVQSNVIYTLHVHPAQDGKALAEEHERWNQQFSEPFKRLIPPHANDRNPQRRLRIGYVSPDFRSHAAAFFLAPLLEAHDHERYEIYCYSNVRRPDAVTQRLRKSADVWREVRAFSDARLAGCVRDDGIDIVVDLAMHTAGNRLPVFARKPAPVQVSWLAYPGSTGVEAIDYRLTDAHIDPPGQGDTGPGEQAFRLPDSWCCYAPIENFPSVSPPPATDKGWVTFGSLHQFGKIHESLLHCWAKLLKAVPDSRLLMICPEGLAREQAHAVFAAHGITRERVEFVAHCFWPDYVRLFEKIDVALDPFPCNGMTTTCHALWMGVPVVALAGTRAISRAGDSLLRTVGLPEWVAQNEEDYIRIATRWADDLPRLAALRGTLRSRMQNSPLMDAPRFARNVEAAYRATWQRWCAEERT